MTDLTVTVHFQSTGTVPGNGRPVTMFGGSMTIGRGPENDLVLPDSDKAISKRHCAIELSRGVPVAVDMSTNGTFLNYGKIPIGDVPTPLNDGDVLTIGTYELLLEIREAPAVAPSGPVPGADPEIGDLLGGPGDGDDFLDDLLGDGAKLTGPSGVRRRDDFDDDGLLAPLDDDEILGGSRSVPPAGGASQFDHASSASDFFQPAPVSQNIIPDDWDPDDLLGDGPFGAPAAATPRKSTPIPEDPFTPDPFVTTQPERAMPPRSAVSGPPVSAKVPRDTAPPRPATTVSDAAARAFLAAAGADRLNISDDELEATMARCGQVMRILIAGLREVLMTRTSIKSEFRIEQTVIGTGGNNPLKFSISPEQAIEAMIKPSITGYLDPVAASEQALGDIKAHEIAMMTGLEAALQEVLRQLSPEELEKKMQSGGGLGGLLKGRKARYWEVYEKMYAEISDRAENEFHEMFGREFARAYQAQLDRLK